MRFSLCGLRIPVCFCSGYKRLFFIFLFVFAAFTNAANAQDSLQSNDSASAKPPRFKFGGYVKDLQLAEFTNNANSLITGGIIHNRLNFKYFINSHFTFTAEERNLLYYGELAKYTPGLNKSADSETGYFNLTKTLVNQQTIILHSQFDRLNINWHTDKWDVTIGRQRINWGIALAWNPNDLFNAYNLLNFDYEERPGNDAVRVIHYFGNFSSLEVAAKPGTNANQDIIAGLYKFNFKGYDIQFLGGLYNKDLAIGAGWAGNIKNAGFKGEISWFQPRPGFQDSINASMEVSVTADYSFKNGLYINFSALYNNHGSENTFNLAVLKETTLSADNLLPFRYSFLAQAQKPFTPIFSGNFGLLYAPGINAFIFLPTLSYNLSNTWDLDLIGQSFFATINSKFQTAGNAIYLRLRWSF